MLFSCLLAAALLALPLAAQSKPDFSGTWKLNVAKSEMGGSPVTEIVVRVDHKEPIFKYIAKGVSGGEAFEDSLELNTSGKPTPGPNGMTSVTRWEGNAILVEGKSADGAATITVRFSMSADGKTAIRDAVMKFPDGQQKLHEIYEKQ
jgi:hypothetical protein